MTDDGHGTRTERARTWPSRNRACARCGVVRRSHRSICKRCSDEGSRTMKACPRCGALFWPWASGDHARTYCCHACVLASRRKPKQVSLTLLPSEVACLHCTDLFEPRSSRQQCCGKTCRERWQAKHRKLQLRGLEPTPITARQLQHDGHVVCALCSSVVDFSLKYPNPMAATVDHVVPITRGGRNVRDNTQLAHARCNTSKGNRPPARQGTVGAF